MARALRSGGHAIIGTFALDGPTSCSDLPVACYDAVFLRERLCGRLQPVSTVNREHRMRWSSLQRFISG